MSHGAKNKVNYCLKVFILDEKTKQMKLKDYIVLDNVIPYARASQCYYMLQGLRGEIAIFTSDDPVDSSEILDSGINKKSESSETKSRWQDRTLCVRLLRSDSVEFENYPVEQGS